MISLQEFEKKGGCEGCYFYCVIEEERKACTFRWFDDDCGDWGMDRNCNDIEERICE